MEQIQNRQTSSDNIEEFVNSRFVDGDSISILQDVRLCYATSTNKTRNAITASTFQQHLLATHPSVDHNATLPPNHTLMIEVCIIKKIGRSTTTISPVIHKIIVSSLGDNNVKQLGTNTKVDSVVRLYPDAQFMCNNNDDLAKGQGNGTP